MRLQEEYETIYCVVDLHAMTVPYDPRTCGRKASWPMLLAMGIDPERSLLYHQSDVPQHAELSWILGTLAGMGQLERMTQYKEKSDKAGQQFGLFAYPVLMAADILIHRAHAVPVGDDQTQHLELTRDLAERFNHRFGDLFPVPEAIIPEVGARVMSLTDPTSKMSKSDPSPKSRVHLTDTPDEIASKIRSAVTDAGSEVVYDREAKPGISNLLEIFSAFDGGRSSSPPSTTPVGVFKITVAEAVIEVSDPFRRPMPRSPTSAASWRHPRRRPGDGGHDASRVEAVGSPERSGGQLQGSGGISSIAPRSVETRVYEEPGRVVRPFGQPAEQDRQHEQGWHDRRRSGEVLDPARAGGPSEDDRGYDCSCAPAAPLEQTPCRGSSVSERAADAKKAIRTARGARPADDLAIIWGGGVSR